VTPTTEHTTDLVPKLLLGNALSRSSASRTANPRRRTARRPPRPAFTLVEVIAALILLAAVFGVIGNLLVRASQQSRAADRRRIAQQAASNVLEDLTGRPWEAIVSTPDDGDETTLAPDAAAGLPGGTVTVDVETDASGDGKRIVVEIRWAEPGGDAARPARLVTWVHRDGRSR
jgi:type II secretory pathway pseudopilin PulG